MARKYRIRDLMVQLPDAQNVLAGPCPFPTRINCGTFLTPRPTTYTITCRYFTPWPTTGTLTCRLFSTLPPTGCGDFSDTTILHTETLTPVIDPEIIQELDLEGIEAVREQLKATMAKLDTQEKALNAQAQPQSLEEVNQIEAQLNSALADVKAMKANFEKK